MGWLALYFRMTFIWLQSEGEEMKGKDNNQDTITIVHTRNKETLNKGSSFGNKKEGRHLRGSERSSSYESTTGWARQ